MFAEEIFAALNQLWPSSGLKLRDIEAFLENKANHRAFEDFKKNPRNMENMISQDAHTNAAMWAWYIYHVLLIWSASGW